MTRSTSNSTSSNFSDYNSPSRTLSSNSIPNEAKILARIFLEQQIIPSGKSLTITQSEIDDVAKKLAPTLEDIQIFVNKRLAERNLQEDGFVAKIIQIFRKTFPDKSLVQNFAQLKHSIKRFIDDNYLLKSATIPQRSYEGFDYHRELAEELKKTINIKPHIVTQDVNKILFMMQMVKTIEILEKSNPDVSRYKDVFYQNIMEECKKISIPAQKNLEIKIKPFIDTMQFSVPILKLMDDANFYQSLPTNIKGFVNQYLSPTRIASEEALRPPEREQRVNSHYNSLQTYTLRDDFLANIPSPPNGFGLNSTTQQESPILIHGDSIYSNSQRSEKTDGKKNSTGSSPHSAPNSPSANSASSSKVDNKVV